MCHIGNSKSSCDSFFDRLLILLPEFACSVVVVIVLNAQEKYESFSNGKVNML